MIKPTITPENCRGIIFKRDDDFPPMCDVEIRLANGLTWLKPERVPFTVVQQLRDAFAKTLDKLVTYGR